MYDEYLRRNLLVCKAVGAKSIASKSLKRLEQQTRPPKWLVAALRGILERTDPLPEDLAKWRNTASDAPEYVRAVSDETSAAPCDCDRSSSWKCKNGCNDFRCSCACHKDH